MMAEGQDTKQKPLWMQDLIAWLEKIEIDNFNGEERDNSLWVQDLIAWLEKIEINNFNREERDNSLWVQDLIACLEKIGTNNLDKQEWETQVKEPLAKVSSQPIPDNIWRKVEKKQEAQKKTEHNNNLDKQQLKPLSEKQKANPREELEKIKDIYDKEEKSEALVAIVSQLSPTDTELLKLALTLARETGDKSYKLKALEKITEKISSENTELVQLALALAREITDKRYKAEALATIVPLLSPNECQDVLKEALESAKKRTKESDRAEALQKIAEIADKISLKDTKLVKEIRTLAGKISDKRDKVKTLTAIAPLLPSDDHLLDQAKELVNKISDKSVQTKLLKKIVEKFSPTDKLLLKQLNTLKAQIAEEEEEVEKLKNIDPQLSSEERQALFKKLLTGDSKITIEDYKAETLEAIAPKLSPNYALRAFFFAREIMDKRYQAEALATISPLLSPDDRQDVLEEALTLARGRSKEYRKAKALKAIIPQLTPEDEKLRENFLEIVFELEDKENRTIALTEIAFQDTEWLIQQCSQSQLSTIIEIIPKGKTSEDKCRLLSALAPSLFSGLLDRALGFIKTDITHPVFQAESLSNLAPYLSSELLPEAIELINNDIVGYAYPTDALCSLIPYLNCEQLKKVLEVAYARKLEHPKLLTQILQTTVTRLNILVTTDNSSKPEDIKKQKNEENELISEILNKTKQHITDEASICSIVTKLATVFNHENQLVIIQKIFNQLKRQDYQAQIIAELAKSANLTPVELAKQAKNLRQQIPKAIALTAFIPNAPSFRKQVIKLYDDTSLYDDPKLQIALILATRPHPQESDIDAITKLRSDQSKALRIIRSVNSDYNKAEALVQLAAHLLPNLSQEAESIAQDIQQPEHRTRSLIALSDYFPFIRSEIFTHLRKVEDKCEYIELLSQFATIDPNKINDLIKKIRDYLKEKNDNKIDTEFTKNERKRILIALKPHLPLRLKREIERVTSVGLAPAELLERSVFVLLHEYRQALKSGTILNDADFEEDLLNLKDEINALTEMLLMRDLSPPVTVGILGGWGGGKSYIMHLMQTHMTRIRSQAIKEEEAWGDTENGYNPDRQHRFVGHIYQIKFDAWTYAKANLWASLMQTIFLELDRQITLENQIAEKLITEDKSKEEVFCEAWPHWGVLYEVSDEDRRFMLKQVLDNIKWQELENNQKSLLRQKKEFQELLWKEYGKVEQQFQDKLDKQKVTLDLIEQQKSENQTQIAEIKAKIDQIKKDYKKREKYLESDIQQAIHSSLDIAETILINRLGKAGQTVFENIYPQIYVELEKQNIDTRQLDAVLTKASQKVNQIIESGKIKQVVDGQTKTINLTWEAFVQWFLKNLWLIIGFGVLGLSSVSMPIIVDIILQEKENISAQIASLIIPLVPAIGIAQKLLVSSQKWYSKVESVLIDYKEQLREYKIKPPEQLLRERRENDPLLKSLSQQTQQLIQVKNNLEIHQIQLEQQVSEVEKAIAETEAELPQDQYSILSSFVRSRIEDNSYEKHLGLMHQIKEDIWKLSKSLLPPKNAAEFKTKLEKLKKVFPRGMARVVVYIDDLDRCPPDAVIEVLEAVQLLVHSPLFIAVLAIDERYINRALAKKYQGVLSLQGRPSASDYLEKIIQIPYRVRPLAEEAIRSYLKAQVVVQDSETSGTKFNEFSPQEFNRLVNCCQEVELSPRSLKRLTNVYKLYKVLSRTRGQKPTREEQTALMVLLAFTGRYPDLMRDIIEKIGSIYEEKRHHADNQEDAIALYQVFQDYVKSQENGNKHSINPNIPKIRHDFEKLIPQDLKLNQIRTVFDFVRSFSFVGDIGISNDLPEA